MQNRAAGADNPTAFVVNEVYMYQLQVGRRVQHLPRFARVSGNSQDAANDIVAATGRANYPTPLLTVETQTVKFG